MNAQLRYKRPLVTVYTFGMSLHKRHYESLGTERSRGLAFLYAVSGGDTELCGAGKETAWEM